MSTLTVANIKSRVKRKFGDESGVQITDSDILDWINDAQRKIASRNDSMLEKTATANTVAGQQEYSFPVDLLKFKGLHFKNTGELSYKPLEGLQSVHEFDLYVDGWDENTSTKGIPEVYTVHASKFLVYPIPQDSVTAGFKVYYCRKPTDMVLDADVLDLPEPYHGVVVDIVLQDAYEMDEDWQAAGAKSQQTNIDLDRLRSSDEWTKRETYPVITVRVEDL